MWEIILIPEYHCALSELLPRLQRKVQGGEKGEMTDPTKASQPLNEKESCEHDYQYDREDVFFRIHYAVYKCTKCGREDWKELGPIKSDETIEQGDD